jgi:hypothetical protein
LISVPNLERKDAATTCQGGKISLSREYLSQFYRDVKGALSQLEQLLAEEEEQAWEN